MAPAARRRLAVAALTLTAGLALGGCGYRNVTEEAGPEYIPGSGALHVFCDRFGTLIYFTRYNGSDDQYEAFFAQACVPGTRPIVSTLQIAPAAQQIDPPAYWSPDGDLGNTQPGTEDEGR